MDGVGSQSSPFGAETNKSDSIDIYKNFGGIYCLHLQGIDEKIETASSIEKLISINPTKRR
jgi:hypothetical protein